MNSTNELSFEELIALKKSLKEDGYDIKGAFDLTKYEFAAKIIFPDQTEQVITGCKNEKEALIKAINLALNFRTNGQRKDYN